MSTSITSIPRVITDYVKTDGSVPMTGPLTIALASVNTETTPHLILKRAGAGTKAAIQGQTSAGARTSIIDVGSTTIAVESGIAMNVRGLDSTSVLSNESKAVAVSPDGTTRHLEAKATAGAACQESVTWTQAYSAAPIVASSVVYGAANGGMSNVVSRSTTGATLESYDRTGASINAIKLALALEAT